VLANAMGLGAIALSMWACSCPVFISLGSMVTMRLIYGVGGIGGDLAVAMPMACGSF